MAQNLDDLISKLKTLRLNGKELTENEKKIFKEFIKKISSAKNRRIIYRGDENLFQKCNVEEHCWQKFSKRFFMLGCKGSYFQKEKKCKLLEDVSHKGLFEFFHKKLCNNEFQNPRTSKRISNFIKENTDFINFFRDNRNQNIFDTRISQNDKNGKIIDYYLSLLHTIGKSANSDGLFLSCTTNLDVAKRFSSGKYIILGWVPYKNMGEMILRFYDINNKFVSEITSLGLPAYNKSLYPNQEEICLKYGYLPHFIIGVLYEDGIEINPSIFDSNNVIEKFCVSNGLKIDQTFFFNHLSESNYSVSFSKKGELYKKNTHLSS